MVLCKTEDWDRNVYSNRYILYSGIWVILINISITSFYVAIVCLSRYCLFLWFVFWCANRMSTDLTKQIFIHLFCFYSYGSFFQTRSLQFLALVVRDISRFVWLFSDQNRETVLILRIQLKLPILDLFKDQQERNKRVVECSINTLIIIIIDYFNSSVDD